VTGIFRQKNPGNAIILLVYALIIKFSLFLSPKPALQLEGDNYIYHLIVRFFDPLYKGIPIIYSILTFVLLFTQATLLNRLCNNLKLFPRPNYLTGMAYILVTSLMKDWNVFSAPLLVNSLLIWIWFSMMNWYNSSKPKSAIFNTSLLVGLLPLIYSPSLAYLILLLFALMVIRPFRITEWFVGLLGLITPYYFLFVVLFLIDKWSWSQILPKISLHLPQLPHSLWITGGIILLLLPFLIGGYFIQANLNKMLIQMRKSWSMLLLMLVVSILIIMINPGNSYLHWMLLAVPIAAFHGAAYYFPQNKWFPLILHWVIFAFVIVLNYAVI